jgi:hypothetical protein
MNLKFTKKSLTIVAIAALCLAWAAVAFAQAGTPSLTINKRGYAPGESIAVSFTAPAGLPTNAWVGVIPSSVPHGSEATNDQNDISYQYLNGMTSGTLTFAAPTTPGTYDLRMNSADTGGAEIASVTFTVAGSAPMSTASLRLSKTTFSAGEAVSVSFTAPAGLPTNAWVGVIPSWVAHGSEPTNDENDISYQYLNGMTSGTLIFSAPMAPGSYDLRMNSADTGGAEIASVTFTVK